MPFNVIRTRFSITAISSNNNSTKSLLPMKSPLSISRTGIVTYLMDDYIVRRCSTSYAAACLATIFECGLANELIELGLIPSSFIRSNPHADIKIEAWQERIEPLIYPCEWSPEMLRAAALCTVRVNQTANKYGYELRDAHPFNVVFRSYQPLFVDLGSFIPVSAEGSWIAEDEFSRCFLHPLRLAEQGLFDLYRSAFTINENSFGLDILLLTGWLPYIIGPHLARSLRKLKYAYKRSLYLDLCAFNLFFRSKPIAIFAYGISAAKLLPGRRTDLKKIESKISSVALGKARTAWGSYHQKLSLCDATGTIMPTHRMKEIVEVIGSLNAETILELAGNRGVLSRSLGKTGNYKTILCTDCDCNAIDHLYIDARKDSSPVYMACFDFMRDLRARIDGERMHRFKSDVVIALAVTHHLVLSQGYSLESVLDTICDLSKRYVVIEFMPLGLWDGSDTPNVPNWYNDGWFYNLFSRRCTTLYRLELEPNRICYVGEKI